MTRQDHLLVGIAEECVEAAQRATKALRFGLEEVQPGQDMNNAERFMQEFMDLVAVMKILADENDVFRKIFLDNGRLMQWKMGKIAKFEHFLEYSAQQGRLEK